MEEDLLELAAERLAEDPRVVAVWGFGSRARREAGPGSDVDVAVLLEQQPDLVEELRLRSLVVEALRRDDVDLVVLNGAPPLVRHEAVAAGRRLFARDDEAADEFEERAAREAFDTAYLRRVQQELAREARS
jgi:predicted nucleotidyltransferase